MKQPNLGYADVKLDFTCMHPAGCACRVSLCDYYDLCGSDLFSREGNVIGTGQCKFNCAIASPGATQWVISGQV